MTIPTRTPTGSVRARYYALIGTGRTPDNPYSVFRHRPDVAAWEVWKDGAWVSEPSLMSYVYGGEVGAVGITKAQADRVRGGRRRS